MNDEKYMEIAINEAKKALSNDEIPVGAIIVLNDKVIAKAYNTKNKTNMIVDHAELKAIKKANKLLNNWRLEDCTMYITLEPCPMCASAIEQCRIKKIVTGAPNNNIRTKYLSDEILKKIEVKKGILSDESKKLLNLFFENKR